MSDLAPSSEIPENLALDSQKLIQAGSSTPGSYTTLVVSSEGCYPAGLIGFNFLSQWTQVHLPFYVPYMSQIS